MTAISKTACKSATALLFGMAILTGITTQAISIDDLDRMNRWAAEFQKCVDAEKNKGTNSDEAAKGLIECLNRIDGYSPMEELTREEFEHHMIMGAAVSTRGVIVFQKVLKAFQDALKLVED